MDRVESETVHGTWMDKSTKDESRIVESIALCIFLLLFSFFVPSNFHIFYCIISRNKRFLSAREYGNFLENYIRKIK